METLAPTAGVHANPAVPIPAELVRRMATSRLSADEYLLVLVVALMTRVRSEGDAAVSERALLSHDLIVRAEEQDGTPVRNVDWIWQSIERALSHGLLIRFTATAVDFEQHWYMLNTLENAAFVSNIVSGNESPPSYVWIDKVQPRVSFDRPTVFRLYEQNIGPLTPLVADRLIKAVELYPVDWIEAAIAEAVSYNRRSWRYIARILENWATDGVPSSSGQQ
ncbi:MAG: DnaD domain protein [Chloroflexota bacterium]|nr:DnaD domain protein [Chloroflexota bacterium]